MLLPMTVHFPILRYQLFTSPAIERPFLPLPLRASVGFLLGCITANQMHCTCVGGALAHTLARPPPSKPFSRVFCFLCRVNVCDILFAGEEEVPVLESVQAAKRSSSHSGGSTSARPQTLKGVTGTESQSGPGPEAEVLESWCSLGWARSLPSCSMGDLLFLECDAPNGSVSVCATLPVDVSCCLPWDGSCATALNALERSVFSALEPLLEREVCVSLSLSGM